MIIYGNDLDSYYDNVITIRDPLKEIILDQRRDMPSLGQIASKHTLHLARDLTCSTLMLLDNSITPNFRLKMVEALIFLNPNLGA